eukprot:CAMPEP_0172931106 /NCGR_PEP_ID=MMETSP1075-20121228/219328_1 /TAXON_ID=2916 /ORGANISM="Ceratium fusus, Strain PA161109" /LENGTH=169 /DNA_ID=CAMNT_0013792421 /DNA_START=857 /DNA_END=1366 /DNA_ORIENTATION=-
MCPSPPDPGVLEKTSSCGPKDRKKHRRRHPTGQTAANAIIFDKSSLCCAAAALLCETHGAAAVPAVAGPLSDTDAGSCAAVTEPLRLTVALDEPITTRSRSVGKNLPDSSTSKNSYDERASSWSASRPLKAYSASCLVRGGLKLLVPRKKPSRSHGLASNASNARSSDS